MLGLVVILLVGNAARASSEASADGVLEGDALVPMPDGVMLSAKVYLPAGEGPFPALLQITPYGTEQQAEDDRRFAAAGYAVVTQNARGQGGAAGTPSPFINEIPDLTATLDWLVAQPWSDGRLGFIVGSSSSYSAQLAASTGHPAIRALVNVSGLTDPKEVFFPGGAFRLNTLYPWMQFFFLHDPVRGREAWQERFLALPLASGFAWEEGLLRRMAAGRVDTAKIRVPTLHLTGWNDVVYRQTLLLHRELAEHGVTQRLVVGPWMHNHIGSGETRFGDEDYGPESAMDVDRLFELSRRWVDRFVRGDGEAVTEEGARVFVMGRNEWEDYSSWPPPSAVERTLYLAASPGRTGDSGGLTMEPGEVREIAYRYQPDDPIPTFGGVNSHLFPDEAGPRDQAELGTRDDVLVFTTAPLERSLTLAGPQKAVVRFSADVPDADVVVKLILVRPDGYERIVEDGIVRTRYRSSWEEPTWLEPGRPVDLTVDLGSTAIEVPAGHRIGVHVAASNFPKYDRNPSTREDPFRALELRAANHTLHLGGPDGSHLVLSVIE